MSDADKGDALEQFFGLLGRGWTAVHEAEAVFHLSFRQKFAAVSVEDCCAYDFGRPFPHASITCHDLVVVDSRWVLSNIGVP